MLGMVYCWAQDAFVCYSPDFGYSTLGSTMLTITKVETNKQYTVVSFHLNYPAGRSISFSKETMLKAGGKEYHALSSTVLTLNEEFKMSSTGKANFTITFEPLPMDVESFDFTMPHAFTICNIHSRKLYRKGIDNTYWCNDNTGDWLIGFTDNCVIYDCKFWNFDKKKERNDAYTITASNNEQQISIKVSKSKNGIRRITIGKQEPAVCSVITSEFLPDYPVKDTDANIMNNNYHEGDSVTIIGWLKNMPAEAWAVSKEFSAHATSLFTDKDISKSVSLDSLGRFTLRMPVENSIQLFTDWGRSYIPLFVEPNETYFLMKDFESDQTLVMGKNARLQNELLAYKQQYDIPDHSELLPKIGALAYLEKCDSTKNEAMKNLDSVIVDHPTLSERYRTFQQSYFLTDLGSDLMQGRFDIPNLPNEYINYVTENIWNKLQEPYTLTNNGFTTFMTDYSVFLSKREQGGKSYSIKQILLMAEKDGIVKLTDEDKRTIDEYMICLENFNKTLGETADSLKKTLMNEFNADEHTKKMIKIYSRNGVQEYYIEKQPVLEFESFLPVLSTLGWSQNLRDIYISRKLCRMIDATRKPLGKKMLEFADTNIQLPMAKSAVLNMHENYVALERKQLSSSATKSSDDVKGIIEGEKILQKIIEPYKGKFILLDIWGTWCSPCKKALSHSQEEYERLKPYDMVFLYLANRSADNGWKNVIKEYNVTGDNVVHYNLPADQQNAVENFVGVKEYPTYKLIDRAGKVLDINADPRDLDGLEKLIKGEPVINNRQ